jgi:hypothetical protein
MLRYKNNIAVLVGITVLAFLLLLPRELSAHCDGLDGPVVKAARKALETENVNPALIWVQKQDEGTIKEAFQKTLAVRKLSPEAQRLADMYFFETLVRIHRAGEGAPYTGLKPAGRNLGPAIPAADKALESGSFESLNSLITDKVQEGIRKYFKEAIEKKDFGIEDVEAGREYIKAYVLFIHYVERLYEASLQHGQDQYPKEQAAEQHEEKH